MGKWREMRISAIPLSKFREKVGERRETWCDSREREKKRIVTIPLPKLGERKKIYNYGDSIAEIWEE